MATNIKLLVEQVQRRLAAGDPSVAQKTHYQEIRKALEQTLNTVLKTQYFDTLNNGETIPEGCVLANYTAPVVPWNGISKSVLPAIPVSLPKNMGVWNIDTTTSAFGGFIPIPLGQTQNVLKQGLISDALGQIMYEVVGKEIRYSKDLTALSPAITSVNMQLVVSDFSNYSDYEVLPINADQEGMVLDAVVKIFLPEQRQPNIVDSTNDSKN